jgi:hypothetical protein
MAPAAVDQGPPRTVQRGTERGRGVEEAPAHPGVLCALTREEPSDNGTGHPVSDAHGKLGREPPGAKCLQPIEDLGCTAPAHGEPVRVM